MKNELQHYGKHSPAHRGTECLNCSNPLELSDRYCSYCGQLNSTKRLSLGNYLDEFFISLTSFDSRFRYTVKDLLFKPGTITRNYVEGKRLKYANPFRFFLSTSIIYFLLSGIINYFFEPEELTENQGNANLGMLWESDDRVIPLDSIAYYKNLTPDTSASAKAKLPFRYVPESELLSVGIFQEIGRKYPLFHDFYRSTEIDNPKQAMDSLGYEASRLNIWLYERNESIKRIEEKPLEFLSFLAGKIPIFLFFFTPVFAVCFMGIYFRFQPYQEAKARIKNSQNPLLRSVTSAPYAGRILTPVLATVSRMFHLRQEKNYIEHVIFIFHIFTFIFLGLLLLLIPDLLIGEEVLTLIFILLVGPFYFYKALRNFYRESRFLTIFKFVLLNIVFLVLAGTTGALFFLLTAATY